MGEFHDGPIDTNCDDIIDKTFVRKVRKVIEAAQRAADRHGIPSHVHDILVFENGYAEPGYRRPTNDIVVLGNWNPDKWAADDAEEKKQDCIPTRLLRCLDRMGVETEWEDEWSECSNCGRLVRTEPNSYGWRPSFVLIEDGLTCHSCLVESPDLLRKYLERLEGGDKKILQLDLDPTKNGYQRLDIIFCNGMHTGMTDDPSVIGANLRRAGVTRYLFKQTLQSQFHIEFTVWVHESQARLARNLNLEDLVRESNTGRTHQEVSR